MSAIQWISLIGSIIGTVTGLFVFFDRFARGRPIGFIVVKGSPNNALKYIRVKNVGAIDIVVTDIRARPRSFEISRGHSVRDIAGAITEAPAVVILSPNQEYEFPFFENPKRSDVDDYSGRITFVIHWRKASSTWLRQMPVLVLTSTGDLRMLEEAL